MTEIYQNNEVNGRILSLLEARGFTRYKLSQLIGISQSSISSNLTGKSRWGVESLIKISKLFKVSIDWLISGTKDGFSNMEILPSAKYKQVPVIGFSDCGKPASQWMDDAIKVVEMNDVVNLRNPFMIIAKGDSMRPYINPGDKLLCTDEPNLIKNRSAVVVIFKSPPETLEANAKLILFSSKRNNMITLYSVNTTYEPTFHHEDEIAKLYKVARIIRDVK